MPARRRYSARPARRPAHLFPVEPFISATAGVVFGGIASDLLLRRTGSANMARKLPIVCGLLLASGIVTANFVEHDSLVIAVMSLAFFGQGMCNLGWTLAGALSYLFILGDVQRIEFVPE